MPVPTVVNVLDPRDDHGRRLDKLLAKRTLVLLGGSLKRLFEKNVQPRRLTKSGAVFTSLSVEVSPTGVIGVGAIGMMLHSPLPVLLVAFVVNVLKDPISGLIVSHAVSFCMAGLVGVEPTANGFGDRRMPTHSAQYGCSRRS